MGRSSGVSEWERENCQQRNERKTATDNKNNNESESERIERLDGEKNKEKVRAAQILFWSDTKKKKKE